MDRACRFAALAFAVASAPPFLAALEPVARVQGSGLERTIDCAAIPRVEVPGEGNVVRLVGPAAR